MYNQSDAMRAIDLLESLELPLEVIEINPILKSLAEDLETD